MNTCYRCEGSSGSKTTHMYGYVICDSCKSRLGLLKDNTIQKHVVSREKARAENPEQLSFEEEVQYKLACLEQDYISKKIKLLYIYDRLGHKQ